MTEQPPFALSSVSDPNSYAVKKRSAEDGAVAGKRSMTFMHFALHNLERCKNGFNHPLNSWSTSDWFLAVLGELGEAANVAKKLNRYRDGIPGNKETKSFLEAKLKLEIGDAFIYLDLLAQSLGFSVEEAAIQAFNSKSEELGLQVYMPVYNQ